MRIRVVSLNVQRTSVPAPPVKERAVESCPAIDCLPLADRALMVASVWRQR